MAPSPSSSSSAYYLSSPTVSVAAAATTTTTTTTATTTTTTRKATTTTWSNNSIRRGFWSYVNSFLSRTTKEATTSTSLSLVTAVERVQRAKDAAKEQHHDSSIISIVSYQNKYHFITCPKSMTTNLLQQYDTSILQKPQKTNKLLSHSLTNSNGETWKRQRPIIQRVFGKDSKSIRLLAKKASIQQVLQDCNIHQSSSSSSLLQQNCNNRIKIIDVRQFGLSIATAAMATAVVGEDNAKRIQSLLFHEMFYPTLQSKVYRSSSSSSETHKLDAELQLILNEFASIIANTKNNNDEDNIPKTCIAWSLLQHEHPQGETFVPCSNNNNNNNNGYLSRSEIISNCHSALLAGTQTIATTLASALAHLADQQELQHSQLPQADNNNNTSNGQSKISIRQIVNEVLRVLPPVASLPRCPANHGTTTIMIAKKNHNDNYENNDNSSTFSDSSNDSHTSQQNDENTEGIPLCLNQNNGDMVYIDLLSMAHLHYEPTEYDHDETSSSSSSSSWKLNPRNTNSSVASPFGVGPRHCPAGILSLECIDAALQTLFEHNITWSFTDPNNDKNWIQHVMYRPGLMFPNPILVTLNKAK